MSTVNKTQHIIYDENKNEILNYFETSADQVKMDDSNVQTTLGSLSRLATTVKTSVVNAINELHNRTLGIKGITTSTSVTETGYAADAKTVAEINTNLLKQRVVTLAAGIVITANQDSDVYRLSSVCEIPYSKITNVTPFVGYTSGGQRVIVTPMSSGSDYFVRAWNANTSSVTLTISATVTYKE